MAKWKRVVWTPAEKKLVIEAVIKDLRDIGVTEPEMVNVIQAARAAQVRVLPVGRIRPLLPDMKTNGWLYRAVTEALRPYTPRHETKAEGQRAPAPEASEDQMKFLLDLTDVRTKNEVENVLTPLRESIKGLTQAILSSSMAYPVKAAAQLVEAAMKEKKKLFKVLVVGLLPEQQREVEKRFEGLFEIRMYDAAISYQQLEAMAKRMDAAFAMVRFVRHHHTDAIRACKRSVLIPTGVTELIRKMEEMWETLNK